MKLPRRKKQHAGKSSGAERGWYRSASAWEGIRGKLRHVYALYGLAGVWRLVTHKADHTWRTAWRTLRRYGMAMLWRKICLKCLHLRIASLSPAEYLRRTAPGRKELARRRRVGRTLAVKIRFGVVLPASAGAEEVSLLYRALEEQSFPGWTLLTRGIPAGAALRKTHEFAGEEHLPQALEACGCTHVLFPDRDTVPLPQALFELAEYLERHPETGVLYADDAWYETLPEAPYFIHGKPDFSEIALCSGNYIGSSWCASLACLERAAVRSGAFAGLWRLIESAGGAAHLPRVLFARRASRAAGDPVASHRTDLAAEQYAIEEHLRRTGRSVRVEPLPDRPFFRVREALGDTPLVSILIPNKDQAAVLRRCVDSILKRSSWRNFEIVIVENGSCEPATEALYREWEAVPEVRVVRYVADGAFNYSKVNNFGVAQCRGEYVVFMNNDIEVITPSWLEELLMFGQRPEVGAVGAKLYFPNDTVQHGGVLVGFSGAADHLFLGCGRDAPGYAGELLYARDCSAVTFACCLVRKAVFEQVGGLDEAFALSFNDVDFCLTLRAAGFRVVWTPFAELYHHESLSRGYDDSEVQNSRLEREIALLRRKWPAVAAGDDPFYNANLSLIATDCRLRHPLEQRLLAETREWTARCAGGGTN